MRIVILGCGGTGTWLIEILIKYLMFTNKIKETDIVLVDGDNYEMKNSTRQLFHKLGNKAEVTAERILEYFNKVDVVKNYITIDGRKDHNDSSTIKIDSVIKERDIIFLCVDNNKTRKEVYSYCQKMKDILIINGGNEIYDGNVQLWFKQGGVQKCLMPEKYHKEMSKPRDKNPSDMSCQELAESGTPQLVLSNLSSALLMVNFLRLFESGKFNPDRPEVVFDLDTCFFTNGERKFV